MKYRGILYLYENGSITRLVDQTKIVYLQIGDDQDRLENELETALQVGYTNDSFSCEELIDHVLDAYDY